MLTTSTAATPEADTGLVGLLDVEKIRELRTARGWTQQQAADHADLPGGKVRWGDIETGRRANVTLETLERIADALGVEPRDLLKAKPRR